MKPRVVVTASVGWMLLLAAGYALWGGAQGWLMSVEAAVAAVAGVNHPVMFAVTSPAARVFNMAALVAGLGLRVFVFASVTVWLLRKRVELSREARPPGAKDVRHIPAPLRAAPDRLEVSRN